MVGDRVLWSATADEGSIEQVSPRRNLFYRQDELRTKSFAANLDQILMLVAADPEFSERQLARALIAAEDQQIPVLVVLNKSDLQPAFDRAWQRLAPYRQMGVEVLPLRLQGRDRGQQRSRRGRTSSPADGQNHTGAGPIGGGQKHAGEPPGAPCRRTHG